MESLLLVMPRMEMQDVVRFAQWGRAFSLEFDPQNIEGAAQVISEALKNHSVWSWMKMSKVEVRGFSIYSGKIARNLN